MVTKYLRFFVTRNSGFINRSAPKSTHEGHCGVSKQIYGTSPSLTLDTDIIIPYEYVLQCRVDGALQRWCLFFGELQEIESLDSSKHGYYLSPDSCWLMLVLSN